MYQLLIPQILKMVIYMVVGFALGKTRLINAEQSKSLSLLCLYAAVPSAILSGFQKEYSPEILHNLLMTFVVVAVIHVLFFGINWLLKRMKYWCWRWRFIWTPAGRLRSRTSLPRSALPKKSTAGPSIMRW